MPVLLCLDEPHAAGMVVVVVVMIIIIMMVMVMMAVLPCTAVVCRTMSLGIHHGLACAANAWMNLVLQVLSVCIRRTMSFGRVASSCSL
jgi:hypothetical protein